MKRGLARNRVWWTAGVHGAHQDLTLALMERSAHSLTSTFYALALHSWQRPADIALRQQVGRLGREGEAQMMAATGGVNTHRGAIWALGLLVSAHRDARLEGLSRRYCASCRKTCGAARRFSPKSFSKGVARRSALSGSRRSRRSAAWLPAHYASGACRSCAAAVAGCHGSAGAA